ncbi:hypothetical protein SynPROS71_02404 [Synechococcus sp. PROS-7-1]|uniref:hypothetical protein n=1 Tax=Synechococcus sp. PROS-7-1 TaxID=1442556 RepID=UPI001646AF2A|nr:hypothetical protein [Synechococcus sp. PROS-7-1]QNI86169.1 hypothetical protein SynPROS71_02404 [Synechococcus sp. PROS-7-1]
MLSELDQMETDWMGCMESRDPEAVAAAYRLLGHHMQLTIQQLGPVLVITEAELELGCPQHEQQVGMPTGMPTDGQAT